MRPAGFAVNVNCAGVIPTEGLTVSQGCDGTGATDTLPPLAETVMLCATEAPPACPEKLNEVGVTEMVCALAEPAASSAREISTEFNVFK
jgi:hypothetical protein